MLTKEGHNTILTVLTLDSELRTTEMMENVTCTDKIQRNTKQTVNVNKTKSTESWHAYPHV